MLPAHRKVDTASKYHIPFGEEVITMTYSDDWDSGAAGEQGNDPGSGDGAEFDNDGGNGR